MTQHFVGLDLGSRIVKAVVLRQGLRSGEVTRFEVEETVCDQNGVSTLFEVVQAAGRLMSRLEMPAAHVYCAVSGENVSVHRISLPQNALRRARDVLAFELDEYLPYDVEDAVFDYVEQGRTQDEVLFTVAAVSAEKVRQLLSALQGVGIDPVGVTLSPLCYGPFLEENGVIDSTCAVLDIGHLRTNLVIGGDILSTSRTFLRGGRDLTAALADAFGLETHAAEQLKIAQGLEGEGRGVLRERLSPLVREIQQTMTAHRANGGQVLDRILLCGGGAALKGIAEYLEEKLGLSVSVYAPVLFKDDVAPLDSRYSPEFGVLSWCLAGTDLVAKNRRFNLRQGEFAFKGDADVLRRTLLLTAICVLAMMAAWMFSTVTYYLAVSSLAEIRQAQLEQETERVLRERVVSRSVIEERMMPREEARTPVPRKDAFDILVELSRRIPESVVHDVEQLEIRPKQVTLRGLVNSGLRREPGESPDADGALSPTDLIKEELSEFSECFQSFRIPRVRTVGDRQQYTMEIETTCP